MAALLFTFNSLLLEYAISGTHSTLYIFLMTCLLLALYELGVHERRVGLGAEVEPGGFAARRVHHEQSIVSAELLQQAVAYGVHTLCGRENPKIRQQTTPGSQGRYRLVETRRRARFDVDDDGAAGTPDNVAYEEKSHQSAFRSR